MSHDATLRSKADVSLETVVRRILRTFDAATPTDLEAGSRWYPDAGQIATDLATNPGALLTTTRAHAAAIIAALSPRTPWARNVAGAVSLVTTGDAPGHIGRNVSAAGRAWRSDHPLLELGGPKTRAFAANILGDVEAVTVDVWALRVCGVSEKQLSRRGVYDALAHAHRLAARRRGVDPCTMQAVTWVVARNGRAS